MRVLICEDDVLIALALEDLVAEIGHDVVGVAKSSTEARELTRSGGADLALVDLGLADGWTGPGLVEDLSSAGTVCIVVSGQPEDLSRDTRAVAVLRKPVDESELADLIARHDPANAAR